MRLLRGDCRPAMLGLAMDGELFDACITDPPYHLTSTVERFGKSGSAPAKFGTDGAFARASRGFMGKEWDGGDIAFQPETWRAVYDVMKPGAHLAAFGGTRTFHRMACAIEDAGFEIRDTLSWLYGTGFPKSHNLDGEHTGWGTAMKPAWEPIILARKPLIGTVAANVCAHGTGAIHIDACRIEGVKGVPGSASGNRSAEGYGMAGDREGTSGFDANAGRWPANVLHDGSDEVMAAFAAFGESKSGTQRKPVGKGGIWSPSSGTPCGPQHGDSGTAARFFYSAKAGKDDRNGSKHPTVKPLALMRWLCRLLTPPGGHILDPFGGSGTTLQAAHDCGFRATTIEADPEYQADIQRRIDCALESML